MFDIRDYYGEDRGQDAAASLSDIETDLRWDIDQLLRDRSGRLYLSDRYRSGTRSMEIIYPALKCPENRAYMLTPDKVRFCLSVHPVREELSCISRIIIRPRYAELHGVELAAVHLREQKILVLYLTSPGAGPFFRPESSFVFMKLEELAGSNVRHPVHPLNRYISVIASGKSSSGLEKFFVRKYAPAGEASDDRKILERISSFYTGHGY